MEFQLPEDFLEKTVSVLLVGAGGNGGQMLSGLARLHCAMCELGHPGGLRVTVYDDDTVSVSNIGRQLFSRADVGLNKAIVLTHRVNAFYGLDWKAMPRRFEEKDIYDLPYGPALIVSCVDTRASRRQIHHWLARFSGRKLLWLDLGNDQSTAQVVLGQPGRIPTLKENYLPCVTDLFPEILQNNSPEDNTPSCSMAESLERQDLFINQAVATAALNLLWRLFRNGSIDYHGEFINLAGGCMTPLPVDPDAWKAFTETNDGENRPDDASGCKTENRQPEGTALPGEITSG